MELVSPRLLQIIKFIPTGSTILDVGSDHAYVPLYCIYNDICSYAIAGEVNPQPHKLSKDNINHHKLSTKISARLGSGLTVVEPGEVNGAIIAGMGGTTIQAILEQSPLVAKSLEFLILQPMSDVTQLRHWLWQNGWRFEEEALVVENDIIYQIIKLKPGRTDPLSPLQERFGPLLWRSKSPLLKRVVENYYEKLEFIRQQLIRSSSQEAKEKLDQINNELDVLRKELKQWPC